ncbi:hypothetical protein HN51_007239 [Arachis hypogaea]
MRPVLVGILLRRPYKQVMISGMLRFININFIDRFLIAILSSHMKIPTVAKFRKKGPKHLDKMEFFFEDVVAIGVSVWTPTQDINDNYNDRDNDKDNDDEKEGLENELNDKSTPPNAMRQKRRKIGRGEKRLGIFSNFNSIRMYN